MLPALLWSPVALSVSVEVVDVIGDGLSELDSVLRLLLVVPLELLLVVTLELLLQLKLSRGREMSPEVGVSFGPKPDLSILLKNVTTYERSLKVLSTTTAYFGNCRKYRKRHFQSDPLLKSHCI